MQNEEIMILRLDKTTPEELRLVETVALEEAYLKGHKPFKRYPCYIKTPSGMWVSKIIILGKN